MESQPRLSSSWEVYEQLSREQFEAVESAGITKFHAQLLYNRGLHTVEEMKSFIEAAYETSPDPLLLVDMERAVARIQQALERREHITIYGDYDADGVTSSALLFRALRTLQQPGASLDFHIPHRLRDGCGLNIAALDQLKARGTQLIITTDCASSDVEQAAYARELGLDIIVTDHHHTPAKLPDVYAMVNPWRPDCAYGERYLCGVGIAFKLTQALYRAYKRDREDEKELLDLVAIGTVADIAPLLGENHTLVRLGMQRLNDTHKPGLQALIRSANLQPGRIRERDIAFSLAPRINAAGRMKEASIAFRLLTTDDEAEALALAEELEQLNIARQQETEELMRNVRDQARSQPGKAVILVSGDDWHEGIIGLVAGKLAEELHKPVLVLSNDKTTSLSRGSARSQKGFNIIEALNDFASQLERFGGHAQAAGFTIRSELIEELHTHLLAWSENGGAAVPALIPGTNLPDQTGLVTEQENTEIQPALVLKKVDLVFSRLERLSYELYKMMRQLGPFGSGNPEPTFKMENLRLLETWTSGINKQNLRLRLGDPRGGERRLGTLLRGAPRQQELVGVTHVNIIFRVESSENDARPEIWLKILDLEPVEKVP
ncbi:single-stranded-DNA-specific exonuclease RecJ [Ktedonosporobacter rubrisoli]|uniref:single-stranded-DNA-specific exonuclease RecJ n=1 Tax=Ktedonosporobacter rubrisoli TaxID=2509675 RepID=UPI0013EEE601|nr:single-stranded-DNA-specific exonuclease RecJ [Ktedonosporobacter rubrisoli]